MNDLHRFCPVGTAQRRRQLGLIFQPKLSADAGPCIGKHSLGVKHQPIHIKNHAVFKRNVNRSAVFFFFFSAALNTAFEAEKRLFERAFCTGKVNSLKAPARNAEHFAVIEEYFFTFKNFAHFFVRKPESAHVYPLKICAFKRRTDDLREVLFHKAFNKLCVFFYYGQKL